MNRKRIPGISFVRLPLAAAFGAAVPKGPAWMTSLPLAAAIRKERGMGYVPENMDITGKQPMKTDLSLPFEV